MNKLLLLLLACAAGKSRQPGTEETTGSGTTGSVVTGDTGATYIGPSYRPGPWKYVTAGYDRSCGLRLDGSLECWGEPEYGQGYFDDIDYDLGVLPDVEFVRVDLGWGYTGGDYHACGIVEDGSIVCWGRNESGETNAPTGSFRDVVTGTYASGALDAEGRLVTWGWWGQATSDETDYVDIAGGFKEICGSRAVGTVTCRDHSDTYSVDASYLAIDTNRYDVLCGVDSNFNVGCVRAPGYGDGSVYYYEESPMGAYVDVCMGHDHACALGQDGSIACWGENSQHQLDVPDDRYVQLDCGFHHSCALTTTGVIRCWGECAHGEC